MHLSIIFKIWLLLEFVVLKSSLGKRFINSTFRLRQRRHIIGKMFSSSQLDMINNHLSFILHKLMLISSVYFVFVGKQIAKTTFDISLQARTTALNEMKQRLFYIFLRWLMKCLWSKICNMGVYKGLFYKLTTGKSIIFKASLVSSMIYWPIVNKQHSLVLYLRKKTRFSHEYCIKLVNGNATHCWRCFLSMSKSKYAIWPT